MKLRDVKKSLREVATLWQKPPPTPNENPRALAGATGAETKPQQGTVEDSAPVAPKVSA
ncbi:MAG: hypothetical protein SGJ23_15865 [Alphaproteobacteria bacterium]|nr:hypothetical protein [Alphaproteobacteria bacterium]